VHTDPATITELCNNHRSVQQSPSLATITDQYNNHRALQEEPLGISAMERLVSERGLVLWSNGFGCYGPMDLVAMVQWGEIALQEYQKHSGKVER
jgi:hypothetical protein